jgi:ABC-type multidrug transport system ATPase subunit
VFQNSTTKKTRILVTHALHFLPHVDYIYVVTDGRITERGAYAELIANNGDFSKFVTEFGSREEASKDEDAIDDQDDEKKGGKKFTPGAGIMQEEERNVGAVTASVYRQYFAAGNGRVVVPLLLLSVILLEASTIMWSYWSVLPQ